MAQRKAPATPATRRTSLAYNAAFATFFQRLADDGITANNTLFVITADEGDHFAGANVGRSLTPACSGTPATLGYTCRLPGRT